MTSVIRFILGCPTYSHQKLQRIMNCACRLIIRRSPGTPSSDFLKQLQRLPVQKPILFKIFLLGHRLVHHPQRIDCLNLLVCQNGRVLRSQYIYNFQTPPSKTAFGRRSFSFAVPQEWNRLPFGIKLTKAPSERN